MTDPLSRYIEAATGLTQVTKSKAEQIVKGLVNQGTAVTGNAQGLVDDLLERSQENRDALLTLVRSETKRVIKAMGLASASDVERLQRQLADLRRRLAEREAGGTTGEEAAAESSAKKAAKKTAKKKTTQKAGKKTAKKKTNTKSSGKSSTKKSSS